MARKPNEKRTEDTVTVLSQREGEIRTEHGVIKCNDVLDMPREYAEKLVSHYPELRIIR